MPALRIERNNFVYNPTKKSLSRQSSKDASEEPVPSKVRVELEEIDLDWLLKEGKNVKYPTEEAERKAYRTPEGKAVSRHQWDVYDHILTIPTGKVSTYKDVSDAVGGSPRTVGGALRNNPFAPYIPCHRVIASSLFVGGFRGEWGPEHRTGTQCGEKLKYLAAEGVEFSDNGHLLHSKTTLWRPSLPVDGEESS